MKSLYSKELEKKKVIYVIKQHFSAANDIYNLFQNQKGERKMQKPSMQNPWPNVLLHPSNASYK